MFYVYRIDIQNIQTIANSPCVLQAVRGNRLTFAAVMKNTDMDSTKVVPLPGSDEGKKQQVGAMFDRIAKRYDLLNRVLSMGVDKSWRRMAVRTLKVVQPRKIIDIATGTGDFALALSKIRPKEIVGVDISTGMLEIGKEKVAKKRLTDMIRMEYGDSEQLQYPAGYFDAVTCAYGVRNFENLELGLKEMCRVMRPGGRLAILEFSRPKSFPFKNIYNFYFTKLLPAMGRTVSNDATAYQYLPDSVKAFPDGEAFLAILRNCGFTQVHARPLTMGITTLYTASK